MLAAHAELEAGLGGAPAGDRGRDELPDAADVERHERIGREQIGVEVRGQDGAREEDAGYRFALKVDNPLPAADGCPKRSFASYQYTATPISGDGRSFITGPDRVIHAATGRPATKDDPVVMTQ